MKRPSNLIIHGSWLIALIAAFALGRRIPQQTEVQAPVPRPVGGTVEETSLLSSTRSTGGKKLAEEAPQSESRPIVLSQRDVQDLAREALTDPSPLSRSLALSKLLESLTADNALQVMAALKENRAGGDTWELFRYAWATVDAEGSLADAFALEGRQRREALETTITGWASRSPGDALAWVNALEDKGEQRRYRQSLVEGLADHDIGQATSYVLQLAAEGDDRTGRYLETVTREQLRKGTVNESARWAENLPDGKLKGQAMDSVAGRFVREDPEAAAAWVENFASETYAARVIEEVGDEWAERDPEASVAWLKSLPEGRGQSEGMHSALGEWARRDPTAASEYLVAMPNSALKDSAVSGFAQRVVREDPEAAIAWAGTIAQKDMRDRTIERAAKEWIRRDRPAATAWLEASGLSANGQAATPK